MSTPNLSATREPFPFTQEGEIQYVRDNFGRVNFYEMCKQLEVNKTTLKEMVRLVFPLASRPKLFQQLVTETLESLTIKGLNP